MRVAEAYYLGDGGGGGGPGGGPGAAAGGDPGGGRIINNLTVSGVQTVLLHVKVLEVSRTKLRTAGFDFAQLANSGGLIASGIADMAGAANGISAGTLPAPNMTLNTNPTMAFHVVGAGGSFFGFLNFLRQNNLVKVLSEPTLVTSSGRPAYFVVGGELPYPVAQGLGAVPTSGNGMERRSISCPSYWVMAVSAWMSGLASAKSTTREPRRPAPPALTLREADAGVEMRAGETLSIAGLVQTQIEASNRGVPILSDIPYLGALFRTVSDEKNEIETLILVTPELAEPMAPHEVPPFGPGQQTTNPSDWQLYVNGELEVPNLACQPNGVSADLRTVPAAPPMAPLPPGSPPNLYNPQGLHPPVTNSSDPADSKGLPGFPGPIGYDKP